MSKFRFNCPKCSGLLEAESHQAATKQNCFHCKEELIVPYESPYDYLDKLFKMEVENLRKNSNYKTLRGATVLFSVITSFIILLSSMSVAARSGYTIKTETGAVLLVVFVIISVIVGVIIWQLLSMVIDIADSNLKINAREQLRMNIDRELELKKTTTH